MADSTSVTADPEDFDPIERSETFRKLLPTLTPYRKEDLIRIAKCPEKPTLGDRICCGSSCDPCIKTILGQELRIWKECRKIAEPTKPITIAVDSPPETKQEPKKETARLWSW